MGQYPQSRISKGGWERVRSKEDVEREREKGRQWLKLGKDGIRWEGAVRVALSVVQVLFVVVMLLYCCYCCCWGSWLRFG